MLTKQVESIIEYFNSGMKESAKFQIGLEIEHLIVDARTKQALPYFKNSSIETGDPEITRTQTVVSVEAILERLAEKYRVTQKNGAYILGLAGDDFNITLEPGAQLEVAINPQKAATDIKHKYSRILSEIEEIAHAYGANILNYGYQPVTLAKDIEVIPKPRYTVMTQYLSATGKYGLNMMRCSASTQTAIDYAYEADAYNKLRISTMLGPIFCYLFSNTPYFEAKPNSNRLMRMQMWDDLDSPRCSSFFQHLPQVDSVHSSNFFTTYAEYALNTPLMVVDYSQTPEFTGSAPVQIAKTNTASELYPDRKLNKFEIEHILSTYFFDSRLKNYVELRACDSLPIDTAVEYLDLVQRNFYDLLKFSQLVQYFDSVPNAEVINVKRKLMLEQLDDIYGKSLSEWIEYLN